MELEWLESKLTKFHFGVNILYGGEFIYKYLLLILTVYEMYLEHQPRFVYFAVPRCPAKKMICGGLGYTHLRMMGD